MKRRTILASPVAAMAAGRTRRPVRMHVGTQGMPLTRESLEYLKRHAVDHIAGWPAKWSEATLADDLTQAREFCAKFGVNLDVAEQPRLHQPPISAIALGKSPGRWRRCCRTRPVRFTT